MNAVTTGLPALRLQLPQWARSWLFGRPLAPAPRATHLLRSLETRWIDTAAGQQVTCLDGCALLQTQEQGRPRDIILVRGESHACGAGARLPVQAFVATALRIQ